MKSKLTLFLSLLLLVGATGCATCCHSSRHNHALVGCWQAKEDPTVLIFRRDGTFIGQDFKKQRIFGTWVTVNKSEIGFQSLYYSGFYNPQYAEVTTNGMRYAYTPRREDGPGPGFAHCVRIDYDTAKKIVDQSSLNETSERN
ncbi:MAG TPA: hypothetical protein VK815_09870 [Candidatus Acidoferrales bacterium]|nr:hypothetical protein [Candidatus Acidoferrales bacterium]